MDATWNANTGHYSPIYVRPVKEKAKKKKKLSKAAKRKAKIKKRNAKGKIKAWIKRNFAFVESLDTIESLVTKLREKGINTNKEIVFKLYYEVKFELKK